MPTYVFQRHEPGSGPYEVRSIGDPETKGYIKLNDEILSANVYVAYDDCGEPLPPLLSQWRSKYDFHVVPLNCLLVKYEKARGVKELSIDACMLGGVGGTVQIQDIGPKTKWVEKAKSLDAELGLGLNVVGTLLSFAEPPVASVTGKVVLRYKWNPKVSAVVSGFAGRHAAWHMKSTQGQYLDGSHTLLMIVRRTRSVKTLHLGLTRVVARHDVPFWQGFDRAYVPDGSAVPIQFTVSSVTGC